MKGLLTVLGVIGVMLALGVVVYVLEFVVCGVVAPC